MPFEINRGLGKYNSAKDYHAALGLMLGADPAEIRKRYLKIAKALHPDSRNEDNSKKLASDLLSKLVNPAYQILSQEKEREEYEIILRLLGQQLVSGQIPLNNDNPDVQKIMAARDAKAAYQEVLEPLQARQYETLTDALEIAEEISQLNLAYLWRQHSGKPGTQASAPPGQVTPATKPTPTTVNPTKSQAPPELGKSTIPLSPAATTSADQYTDQYYRRAEEFARKGSYQPAIKELRDALKLNPNSSRCHALMGEIYLQQGQLTMAKVSFRRALELNPSESKAVLGMEAVTKTEKKNLQKVKQAEPPKSTGGGLFGLFGKKNK